MYMMFGRGRTESRFFSVIAETIGLLYLIFIIILGQAPSVSACGSKCHAPTPRLRIYDWSKSIVVDWLIILRYNIVIIPTLSNLLGILHFRSQVGLEKKLNNAFVFFFVCYTFQILNYSSSYNTSARSLFIRSFQLTDLILSLLYVFPTHRSSVIFRSINNVQAYGLEMM